MATTSPGPAELRQARRRARLGLAGLGVAVLVALAAVAVLATVQLSPARPASIPSPPAAAPIPDPAGDPGWDWAGEAALATRPMTALPVTAAGPEPLAAHPAPDVIELPAATGVIDDVPAGFPPTPAGALAALAALDTQALRGADPDFYAATYAALAAPGAPAGGQSQLAGMLRGLRASAGLAATGPVTDLSIAWAPTSGQIKGVLDGGRYAVVCVLGQLTADYQGRTVDAGVGDCQAMRFTGGQWLISPGPQAALAPSAWPGSQDAVNAGYQELRTPGGAR